MLQTQRLRNAHQINLESVDEKIKHLEKCDKDYEELISTLERLSSEHRLEIMAPLTKKAFMPGELVHTGEVMVYLGDEWFVNRTVTQGIEIAVRRREKIAAELTDYQKSLANIRNKLEMTSELDEGGIVEELTQEDITRSENRHIAREAKPNVPRPRAAFSPGELAAMSTTEAASSSDEESDEEREGIRSCLRDTSSTEECEDAEDNTIVFSHSDNNPLLTDGNIHPGNLHLLLRTPEEKSVIDKVRSKSRSKQFDINACVIEERSNPASASSAPYEETSIPAKSSSERPVSRFRTNRTS